MVNETISFNSLFVEFIQNLPPDLATSMGTFITILKAAGIIFIVYLIFMIVKTILDIRSKIFIRKTYKKVNEIDEKLNKLLFKKSTRSEK